jgi:hypothetical protein
MFSDLSTQAGGPTAFSEAYNESGMAVIHARYAYGRGELSQTFDSVLPVSIEADYNLIGTCSNQFIYLNQNGQTKFGFSTWDYGSYNPGDPRGPRGMFILNESGDMVAFWDGEQYNSGRIKIEFNGTNVSVYHNAVLMTSFELPYFSVDGVSLHARHSCYDGRNDEYAYFDNVSLMGRLDTDPIAYYSFDNDTLDHSGYSNDGTNHGATFVDGVYSQALSFDGVNDYVSVPSLSTGPNFTISLWVKPNSENPGILNISVLFDKIHNFNLEYRENAIYQYSYQSDLFKSDTNLTVGEWNFVTLVRNTTHATFYLNGVNDGGGPTSPRSLSGSYYFGSRGGVKYQFNGSLDEIKIYNLALNESEIRAEYEKYVPPPTIKIYTDKSNYTYIDVMNVGLDVSNPGDTVNVGVYVWVDLPGGGKYWVLRKPSVPLNAGLVFSRPFWKTIPLLNPTPNGQYAWHAVIYDPVAKEIISESIAPWTFIG